MSQWDPLPTTLTTFGPLSSEVQESSGFLSKFLKKTRDYNKDGSKSPSSSREVSVEKEKAPLTVATEKPTHNEGGSDEESGRGRASSGSEYSRQTSIIMQQMANRTRSSVLSRLSKILEGRDVTPQAYKDSDFKQYWMPDSSSRECYDCGDRFTTFRRRHHCRVCGQIFCSKCCNQELPGRIIGYKGGIRVCTYCGKVALSALQTEPTGNMHVDSDDLGNSTEIEQSSYQIWGTKGRLSTDLGSSRGPMNRSFSSQDSVADFCPEHIDAIDPKILADSAQLRELWRKLLDPQSGVEMQSHRVKLSTYKNCISGNRVVDWLLKTDKVAQRLQAVAIGQALLDAGFLETIAGQPKVFHDDFTLYKPSEASPVDPPEVEMADVESTEQSTEPEWFKSIQTDVSLEEFSASEDFGESREIRKTKSSFITSQDSKSSGSRQENDTVDFEPLPRTDLDGLGGQDDLIASSMFTGSQTITADKLTSMNRGWRHIESLKEENGERAAFIKLRDAYKDHIRDLASQMLTQEGLSKSWLDIILGTADRISRYVSPDVRVENDHMDIRKYIKFKKIPGGNKEQTCMIHGLVFTKNIAHKKMASQITNPQILLMKGSIEYQRRVNKFSSLEPQILQEEEFLKNNISKIVSLKPRPDILVVENTVSRLAQTYLLQAGITLIFNVKMCVLERLARFTQACIVSSIDSIVSGPISLGFCHNFKVLNFLLPLGETKTMLCFDGCATHLGCTVIMRGGTMSELKRLKKIMKWMVFVSYHSKLEISFCMDEFALPVNNSTGNSLTSSMDDLSVSMEVHQPPSVKTLEQTTPDEVDPITDENADDEGLPTASIGTDKCSVGKAETEGGSQSMESFMDMEVEIVVKVQDSESPDKTGKKVDGKESKEMETEVSKEVVIIQEETPIIVCQQDRKDKIGNVGVVDDNRTGNHVNRMTENGNHKMGVRGSRPSSAKHPVGLEVSDQSDPLYNYQKNKDETIFFSSHTLQEKTLKHCQKYKKLLKEVILSCSPFIKYELPYLETEEGSMCFNRKFFPEEIYLSRHLEPQTHQEMKKSKNVDYQPPMKKPVLMWSQVEVVEAHPLIVSQLCLPFTDKKMQEMLADFRARGGRLKLNYDNLPKGPVITYEAKGPKPTTQKVTAQNGALKPAEGESPKKGHNMVDCLDFAQHQRLVVLLSSYSEKSDNHPMPCLPPQPVTMEFYGSQDITLGGFLEKFCFRESYSCQPYTCTSATCDVPMLDHVRRIINSNGAIYISLRKLTNCVPGGERALMMWNWCRKCRQATPLVPMSMDSWNMSFAKYLELRFHATSFVRRVGAEPCSHSLHQFFSQYFGHRNIVATFKYYPITRREVVHPPPVITLEAGMQQAHWKRLKDEIRFLTTKCTDMFASIHTSIVNTNCEAHQETLNKLITDYKAIIPTEKSRIKDLADNTRQLLADIWVDIEGGSDAKDMKERLYLIQDDIVKIKRLLADAIQNWNHKLQELISQQKKYNKQAKKDTSPPLPAEEDGRLSTSASSRHSGMEDSHSLTSTAEFTEIDASQVGDLESRATSGPVKIDPVEGNLKETYYALSTESNQYSVTPGIDADDGVFEKSGEQVDKDSVKTDVTNMLNSQDVEGTSYEDQLKPSKSKSNIKKVGSSDDILDGQKPDRITNIRSRVSNFLGGSSIPNALKVNYSEHHQLPVGKVPVLVYDEEPSSIIAYALGSHEYYTKLQEIQVSMTPRDTTQTKESKTTKAGDIDTGSTDSPESRRKHGSGVLSFLRGSSSRDPSPRRPRKAEYVDTVKYTPKIDQDSVEIDEQDGLSILTTSITSDTERGRGANKQIPLVHIQLQFSDSTAKFYCKIYFAEQFRQLRKLIFPQGEEMFIRSLSRCKLWEAKGGKSGSAFCKTHDNRFILKQMSSTEVEIFEKFGFEYFQYISKCYVEQRPTALAKIVGAYRIGFHNSQTNNDLKQDLLVIENLFYNRNISQTFDLKGSMRNRLVNTSRGQKSEQEVVLLDENLLKLSVDSPLYVYPHSKTVLNRAIERDSEFLANNFVMDYSLLVGIDEGKKELVIGIIDYIRTFTWDKKLEMLLKSRGGLQPTVVSPDIYRTRFLDAMGRYFLPVPDQWSFLGREISY